MNLDTYLQDGGQAVAAVADQGRAHVLPEPNPALVRDAQERASSIQNLISDRITALAGSMWFVYIHIAWFGCWIGFGVERYPYGLLTMIVSLEAIFLSTFVITTSAAYSNRRSGCRPEAQAQLPANGVVSDRSFLRAPVAGSILHDPTNTRVACSLRARYSLLAAYVTAHPFLGGSAYEATRSESEPAFAGRLPARAGVRFVARADILCCNFALRSPRDVLWRRRPRHRSAAL